MLQRLYVHNFRCLENFELNLKDLPSSLLIGKNGSGKSTVRDVLEIFQKIGRGTNRISELVKIKDFAQGRTQAPIRFEMEVLLEGNLFQYTLALEYSKDFNEPRILEEEAKVDSSIIFSREKSTLKHQLSIHSNVEDVEIKVESHLAALPIIFFDQLLPLSNWLRQMIILAPIPSLMHGESQGLTLYLTRNGLNFGDWFSGILGQFPKSYSYIDGYLKTIMPDFDYIQNSPTGRETKELTIKFRTNNQKSLPVAFEDLSDGEKCFFLCAVIVAANKSYGPLFCFWDEPDNYLGLSEVGHFIVSLRRAFENGSGGQFVATSHNPEAIRRFSDENTHLLYRESHLEPARIKLLSEMNLECDLINTLILGDLEP